MRPLRSRHSSTPSLSYLDNTKKDDLINVKKEGNGLRDTLNEDIVKNDTEENQTTVEDVDAKDDGHDDNVYQKKNEVIKRESKEKEETMSTMTCLSCTKCSQPLGWVEKERYVSRMV